MSPVSYFTTCYIKTDLYRLSIHGEENNRTSINSDLQADTNNLSNNSIIPSITFELLSDKKITLVPKEIFLNRLISVQQKTILTNQTRRNFIYNSDIINTNGTVTPTSEQSKQTSLTTLNSIDGSAPPTPLSARPSILRRFFSSEFSLNGNEMNEIHKTTIQINYVDAPNMIRWNLKRLNIDFESEDQANELYINLNLCLSAFQRPRHLLAFVNPFGGKGRARFVYKKLLPIFNEAHITVHSIFTERANQARDFVMEENLNDYDGIVCVGGDGMFAELCHGLLLRTAREANLNIDDPKINLIRPDLRIGIIPAGSTDAIAFNTTGLNDPVTSALQIILGETLAIDVATIHNENGFVRFMASMLAYGFFGDIIQQSDKWRCLGPLRYDLAGFCQFIRNKSYHTELKITLSPADASQISSSETITSISNTNNGAILPNASTTGELANIVKPTADENNKTDGSTIKIPLTCESFTKIPQIHCVDEKEYSKKTNSPSIVKCDGRYTTINCLNMPGRCAKSKFGMSPYVHSCDGTFDLLLVKRSWRTGFLRFLWQVANDSRSIKDLPNVERYSVREVHICPIDTDSKRLGNWACDGELISANRIQIRIHPQVLNIFASGIQNSKIEEYHSIAERKKSRCCPCFRFKSKQN